MDLLEARAAEHPDRLAYRFLAEGTAAGRCDEWTYGHVARRARAIAAELGARGLYSQTVLLLYPPGLEFIAAFLGCLHAGAVAVPAYPPDPSRLQRTLPRLQSIAADARAPAVLTTSDIAAMAPGLSQLAPDLGRLAWLPTDPLQDGDWRRPDGLSGETVAFLQYTSGSTSSPKGVMVTHANLRHNERVMAEAFDHDHRMLPMGWLPLFHDMGLIGHVIVPAILGTTSTLMSPQDFLRRPVEWLRAVSRFRITTSGGPDFGYALCARKVTDLELAELDLSTWRTAYCGAEPVRASTMRRFAERLAPAGLDPRALTPCYGLAESTLMATSAPSGRGARAVAFGAAELVSVGGPLRGTELRIVDPATRQVLPDGQVGEVWMRGESVARGYWDRPELTEETFGARAADGSGPYLRTGDLGTLREGALFITGRAKDLIIIRGRNVYPDDVEVAVEACHPAIRAGGAVAFAVDAGGVEQVALACEVEEGSDLQAVADAARGAAAAAADAPVHAVALLSRRALPKTSSGKKQRGAARQAFLDGTLEEISRITFADQEPAGPAAAADPPPATRPEMEAWLWRQLASVLGRPLDRLQRDATFESLGLDSARAVELASRLDDRLGRPLHPSILYNVPTVARLAAWLVGGPAAGDAAAPGTAAALYPDLAVALERLDRRQPSTYRFDLEGDVPWGRTGEPGLYVPPEMFRTLGL
ncbi:MAG TPA: AMP-binding protein, partial [Myxococcales bacterium]|nr:AMP-binding protein [Myxococcales bacterium]